MIVIADDITGAAEIAGIAFSQGQQVRLVCGSPLCCDHVAAQTMVIATDTRSMSEAEAVTTIKRMILPLYMEGDGGRLLFKKTDSALRGHVVAELSALMEATGYQRAVYLPANPTKGRVIKNGVYYIKEVSGERLEVRDVPISETAFNYDPEFPAKTSVSFVAGVSVYRNLKPEDFTIIVDYDEIRRNPSEKCRIYLKKVPPGISRAKLETTMVDYLIESQSE